MPNKLPMLLILASCTITSFGMNVETMSKKVRTISTQEFSSALQQFPELYTGTNQGGKNLLIHAIQYRRADLVALLLQGSHEQVLTMINSCDTLPGWCPLHYAAWFNLEEIIKLLLKTELLDINIKTNDSAQNTAIHLAGIQNSAASFNRLKEAGASLIILNRFNKAPALPSN